MFSARRFSLVSSLGLTVLVLAHPAAAQTQITAVSFAPGSVGGETSASLNLATGTYDETASYNLGYSFSVSAPVVVTQLGYFADPYYYDPNNPSYSDQSLSNSGSQVYAKSHNVGIYTSGGTLLLSGTVTQTDQLADNFRYTAPSTGPALVLAPGVSYIIAGVTGADDPYFEDVQTYDANGNAQSGLVTASEITYGGSVSAVGSSLADNNFQSSSASDPGLFGPNFRFSDAPASAAPEPAQWGTLGFAVLGLGAGLYRARRRQAAAQTR